MVIKKCQNSVIVFQTGVLEPVSRSPCALLKLDDLTNQCICCMHWSAKLGKSSFSKAQGLRETGSCTHNAMTHSWLNSCLKCLNGFASLHRIDYNSVKKRVIEESLECVSHRGSCLCCVPSLLAPAGSPQFARMMYHYNKTGRLTARNQVGS